VRLPEGVSAQPGQIGRPMTVFALRPSYPSARRVLAPPPVYVTRSGREQLNPGRPHTSRPSGAWSRGYRRTLRPLVRRTVITSLCLTSVQVYAQRRAAAPDREAERALQRGAGTPPPRPLQRRAPPTP